MGITADSGQVSKALVEYVDKTLYRSAFFTALRTGSAGIQDVRAVFEQYYLWRNQFHRWFGVCIVKSAPFGTSADTSFVLSELIEHIEEEINGDHHGMAVAFLEELGVDPSSATPLPSTVDYSDSFVSRYLNPARSGEQALSALAGREIVAPARNRLTVAALRKHYGITKGLEFFSLHEELEVEHFRALWDALIRGYHADADALVDAARNEIREHVTFWDETYTAVAAAPSTVS